MRGVDAVHSGLSAKFYSIAILHEACPRRVTAVKNVLPFSFLFCFLWGREGFDF